VHIKRIIIPAYILDKLHWKHRVTEDEVYELLRGRPKLRFVERGDVEGEDLYMALGQTESGRYLTVFFLYKTSQDALIVSGRDMARHERKLYGKK
jgi:uncharacterized DUF497 family protein